MTKDETLALKEVLKTLDLFLLGDSTLASLSHARALLRLAIASGEEYQQGLTSDPDELSKS